MSRTVLTIGGSAKTKVQESSLYQGHSLLERGGHIFPRPFDRAGA